MAIMLDELRAPLERRTLEALNRQALSNRGTFPAFKLAGAAQAITAMLMQTEGNTERARELGALFGQQGLSLTSVLAAQGAGLEIFNDLENQTERGALLRQSSACYAALIQSFVDADREETEKQRQQMEQAFLSTVSAQRVSEESLRMALRELSTPIIPVAEGILVLPLVGTIDSRRASEINERLLEGIAEHQAEIVIIDITGVPIMDTSTANLLLMTARAANLLGSRIVLCGIGAEIAQTITHLGVELRGLTTLANLQTSITYALGEMGLGIRRL